MQIVNVVLHLVRNLAFIKDLPSNTYGSADQAELSSLQSRLIKGLSESHFIDLLLTIASSSAADQLFNQWNSLVLEIFYLLFRGVKPVSLASDQAKVSLLHASRLRPICEAHLRLSIPYNELFLGVASWLAGRRVERMSRSLLHGGVEPLAM